MTFSSWSVGTESGLSNLFLVGHRESGGVKAELDGAAPESAAAVRSQR